MTEVDVVTLAAAAATLVGYVAGAVHYLRGRRV